MHPSLDLLLKYTIVNLLCVLNIFFTGNSNQDFRQLAHEKVIYIPTASNIYILSQEFMTLSQLMSNLVLTRDLA